MSVQLSVQRPQRQPVWNPAPDAPHAIHPTTTSALWTLLPCAGTSACPPALLSSDPKSPTCPELSAYSLCGPALLNPHPPTCHDCIAHC